MSILSFTRVLKSYFLFSTMIGFTFISDKAFATSCQVYQSEYAYHDDSVIRTESVRANCRNYWNAPAGVWPEHHIHCDGTQLKLADSNFGQEQYQPTDYYVWSSTSGAQLLFIFPTRVSLTTITLHYYSDSVRGLPRLRFYSVPDDFDVWDAPSTSYPHVDFASILPDGESAGHRSVSINVDLNTKRVLMYKYHSSFQLVVSEVEFFTCRCHTCPTTLSTEATTTILNLAATSTPCVTTHLNNTTQNSLSTRTESFEFTKDGSYRTQSSSSYQPETRSTATCSWVLVVLLAVLLIVSLAVHVIQAIWTYRIYRRNKNADTSMSPDCALAMDSNPCYEASNVKQTEAQEAGHVYDTVKQHS